MGCRRAMLPTDDVVAWVCSAFERSSFFATFSYIALTYSGKGLDGLQAA
jgi:hypothetical protein